MKIPFLKDHHTHIFLWTILESSEVINLEGVTSVQQLKSMFCIPQNKEIKLCKNWDDSKLLLSEDDIHHIIVPVIVVNKSLHFFIANKIAQNLLIDQGFEKLIQNRHDKIWLEKNVHYLLKLIMSIKTLRKEDLCTFYNDFLMSRGVYYAEEMTIFNDSELLLFKESGLIDRTAFWSDIETFRDLKQTSKNVVSGIKIFTDGALGTRTAYISESYDGVDHANGVKVFEDDELYNIIKEVNIYEKCLSIHAIGDLAIAQIIKILEQFQSTHQSIPRTRIEHALFINEALARKAKKLGIKLCMQPGFSWDSSLFGYHDRLSEDFLRQSNPFRMLIDKVGFIPGQDLIFGSDGMIHDASFQLSYGLFPRYQEQQLTIDEFVSGYCMPMDTIETIGSVEIDIDLNNQKVSVIAVNYNG